MGGRRIKGGYRINGTKFPTQMDLVDFLKNHEKLQHLKIEDLGEGYGTGRLIWAKNPGSVFWPAIIAKYEDKLQINEADRVAPELYRCVMFLETAFRYGILEWKDIILVDEENFEEQCELIFQLNVNIVKKTWRREKPYKDAVELLRKFMDIEVDARREHAFDLSFERYELKKKSSIKSSNTESSNKTTKRKEKEENIRPQSEKKPRMSDKYSLRPITSSSDNESFVSSALSENGVNCRSMNVAVPSPSSSSRSEPLSDSSAKAKKRPKVGGIPMKDYVEGRFKCMDTSYKFSLTNSAPKCAECVEEIPNGQISLLCHDMPHHPECLISITKNLKDGTTQQQFKCKSCARNACYICKKSSNEEEKCASKCTKCDLKFHRSCLLNWPQAVVQGSQGPITCPAHFCHTCVGEHYVLRKVRNFKAFGREKYRCLLCPATYHKPYCLPAGCGEESNNNIVICPAHILPKLKITQRRFGCLTCGIDLKANSPTKVECSLCLQIFHAECIGYTDEHKKKGITLQTFGKDYKCSSCFWGLFPLYGQPVWYQQPSSKFWPARILYPRESCGRYDFCEGRQAGQYSIKYFGNSPTFYDHASRSSPLSLATVKLFTTVRIYQEDSNLIKSAFDEAAFYSTMLDDMRDTFLPPPEPFYKKIDRNIYRQYISSSSKKGQQEQDHLEMCYCGDNTDNKAVCTANSGCHNRDTAIECNDDNCKGGTRCRNRMFTQKEKDSENTIQFLTPGKGWAVKASKDFKEGDFIVEYCGEIIGNAEMQYRANRKTEEDPLYILEIDKHTFIDAEFCGNVSRLINHSCEPNCRIEKYTSESRPVVGVFAHRDITADEELTFDYSYGNNSSAPFRCHCGTESCRGYIGKQVAASDLEVVDVINPELERYDKECAKCFFGGHVLCCDYEGCFKVYHKSCAGLSREPRDEWFCPDHY